ncbi:actinorhodin polyketide synthase acyl carrier protein [Streptomyces spiroverticillatus]|uniref:Actinorhodin polyketide synthase acyl carrier protein n=1 Tax=Streptomyces finlayi TaxID=67296 RepID=A0A918X5Y4_9ACTN|nr:acyl carrier protein [Streptomyces finlayi]GHA35748.1 actinorhodin polyketide synthase acyl carrier protein [Streptomyces spiroverticillatus]GHD12622.1 actinorhodin polyketide synthase acyl carrier protein [Streptomyces finlayi]
MTRFEITDLTALLRESAGADEGVDLDGEITDVPFDDLGYDSLALLQTTGLIERQWEVVLDEEAVSEARTPGQYLEVVNQALNARAAV